MNPPIETNPGAALSRLIVLGLLTWLFYAWASLPGWELVWLGVFVLGVSLLRSVFDLFQAHRAWKIKNALEAQAAASTGRFDTRQNKPGQPFDGWE